MEIRGGCFYEAQTPIFGRMGETPVGVGGRLMTTLAEGELAKAAPPTVR